MEETKRGDFISKWNNANQDEKDEVWEGQG